MHDPARSAGRGRPRAGSFRDFAPHALAEGRGLTRELASENGEGLTLQWALHLLEVRSREARIRQPAGTAQLVVGLSGPQVLVGDGDARVPLRPEVVVSERTATLDLSRPGPRGGMPPSTLLTLSYDSSRATPSIHFAHVTGHLHLRPDVRVVVVMRGSITHDDLSLPAKSVLSLEPGSSPYLHGEDARVVLLRVP
ncbi:hypothetical protein AB0N73_08435 [Microbacterium sp. NPDC089189]|uniref:hypothetical protein n=1 Tax=Microbacterium sp. NPDC089189 TaxID=3154972 RepID=UPI0034297CD4